jgi:hypothetical protein
MEPSNTTMEVSRQMMVSPYDRPSEVANAPLPINVNNDPSALFRGIGNPKADAIARLIPPASSFGMPGDQVQPAMNGIYGPFNLLSGSGLFAALGGLLQQLGALLTQCLGGWSDNERFFQNATAASVGDPHLSFNGTNWDNMNSHPDLLHSDSIPGGYHLSTEVTQPTANGITTNRQATITTNYGTTSVSLDNNGNANIAEDGNNIQLQPGTTLNLGNGSTVTRSQDGSIQYVCKNESGGHIETTLRVNGTGVDVNVNANNVDLGGYLASERSPHPINA